MKSKWILLGVVASLAVLAASAAFAADGSVLANAIAKQVETAPETLNMQAEPGYLGIPGGPKVNMILAFGWALWVGWIFSTVGAFGGVMAGVGHMTVHGLGAYAKSFGKTPSTSLLPTLCAPLTRCSPVFLLLSVPSATTA